MFTVISVESAGGELGVPLTAFSSVFVRTYVFTSVFGLSGSLLCNDWTDLKTLAQILTCIRRRIAQRAPFQRRSAVTAS